MADNHRVQAAGEPHCHTLCGHEMCMRVHVCACGCVFDRHDVSGHSCPLIGRRGERHYWRRLFPDHHYLLCDLPWPCSGRIGFSCAKMFPAGQFSTVQLVTCSYTDASKPLWCLGASIFSFHYEDLVWKELIVSPGRIRSFIKEMKDMIWIYVRYRKQRIRCFWSFETRF